MTILSCSRKRKEKTVYNGIYSLYALANRDGAASMQMLRAEAEKARAWLKISAATAAMVPAACAGLSPFRQYQKKAKPMPLRNPAKETALLIHGKE
jgi:hypothetical protein